MASSNATFSLSAPPVSKKPRTSSSKSSKHDDNDDDGIPIPEITQLDYVNLTSHTDAFDVDPIPISWSHPNPLIRGPVICTVRHASQRNAIGAHSGSYCIYTGLAVAAGKLNPDYVPNLKLTSPVFTIGPHPSWSDPRKVASIDPFGHVSYTYIFCSTYYCSRMNNIYYLLLSHYIIISSVSFFAALIISPITLQLVKNLSISQRTHSHTPTTTTSTIHHHNSYTRRQLTTEVYRGYLDKGFDIRPTIAVTKAHIDLPETREAVAAGRLVPDGKILLASGKSLVSKAAIEPVWYLPEIARRFGCTEAVLRQSIFRMTNGMYPELVTRPDIKIFLPPIGGLTIYIWGDPDTIPDEDIELTCRVHDECNGSDVFGSDICTCRPYLTHAIEECIKTARE